MAGEVRGKGPSAPHTMSLINLLYTRPGGRYSPGGRSGVHRAAGGGICAKNPEVPRVIPEKV